MLFDKLSLLWQGLATTQAALQQQHMQQVMLHHQNQALYHQLLHPSMSLDSGHRHLDAGHRYVPGSPVVGPEKQAEPGRPWSAQARLLQKLLQNLQIMLERL